jgi:crotonobetaine/carnitine-CoA ligase
MYTPDYQNTENCHLGRVLTLQAEHNGDTDWLVFDDDRYSFRRANQLVNNIAAHLAATGFAAGDRVCLYMDSCPAYILTALAANKLGGVWIPVNSDYKGEWLADTLKRSRPRVLVTDATHLERVDQVRDALDFELIYVVGGDASAGLVAFESLLEGDAPEPDQSGFAHSDTSAVLWTSGTTGRSKGVMQSHNVWVHAGAMANQLFDPQPGDVILNVMPLYNSAAWITAVLRALLVGITCAIDPHFSVSNYWDRVRYYGATQAFTLGAMHMFLLKATPGPDDADNPLRVIQMVPVETEAAEQFAERFGVRTLGQGMSQSEAMTIITQGHSRPGPWPRNSCGNATEHVEVKLVDDDGNEVPVNTPGECWARPLKPYIIFNGYLDDPEATAAAFDGEWLKTGDMLRVDEDGNYFFVDRKKDAVRYKGRNISTFEVESVARRHPAVADCAVCGIPSEELASEDELKLHLIFKPGESVSPEEMAAFINDNAPYFFVPRYIEVVDELPYTPTNKVQKYKLRERGVTGTTWDLRQSDYTVRR